MTYPDYYTNACCSHPLYIDDKPEDVIAAARRKLNHELGIPLDQVIYLFIAHNFIQLGNNKLKIIK